MGDIENSLLLSIFIYCDSQSRQYYLFIKGDAGDSLAKQNGMMFTTRDRDNDVRLFGNCALDYKGAWWYEDCLHSNLNAQYLRGHHSSNYDGVNWGFWRENHYSLKKTEMKIRPRSF